MPAADLPTATVGHTAAAGEDPSWGGGRVSWQPLELTEDRRAQTLLPALLSSVASLVGRLELSFACRAGPGDGGAVGAVDPA